MKHQNWMLSDRSPPNATYVRLKIQKYLRAESTMTIATYKWTIDRYHQAIYLGLFDGQNIELLRGDLVIMPPEGEAHVYFSDRTAQILRRLLTRQAQVREGRPITLPNGSEPFYNTRTNLDMLDKSRLLPASTGAWEQLSLSRLTGANCTRLNDEIFATLLHYFRLN